MNSFVRLLFYCQNVVATKYMPMESTLKNKMRPSRQNATVLRQTY